MGTSFRASGRIQYASHCSIGSGLLYLVIISVGEIAAVVGVGASKGDGDIGREAHAVLTREEMSAGCDQTKIAAATSAHTAMK